MPDCVFTALRRLQPLRQDVGRSSPLLHALRTFVQSERWADTSWLRLGSLLVLAAAGWAALFAAKLALGFALKRAAVAYVQHYYAHAKPRWVICIAAAAVPALD